MVQEDGLMLSVTDAVNTLIGQGLSKYKIANDIGSSTSMITKYANGDVKNITLRIAVRFYKMYEMQIMPYSIEDLSGIHREKE